MAIELMSAWILIPLTQKYRLSLPSLAFFLKQYNHQDFQMDILAGYAVDIAHQSNLDTFLGNIGLVNTHSIDPHQSLASPTYEPFEGIIAILCDLQNLTITLKGYLSRRVAPHV